MNEPQQQHVAFIVALVVAGIGGYTDWRRGEIPNWLTYGALVLAPVFHVGRVLGAKQPLDYALTEGGISVGGAVLCGLVPALLHRQGAIGGGDLKLLAALGAWLQPMAGVEAEMYGFFSATLVAPARLAYQGKLLSTLKNSLTILGNMFLPKAKQRQVDEVTMSWFRLGPFLFFGVLLTTYLRW